MKRLYKFKETELINYHYSFNYIYLLLKYFFNLKLKYDHIRFLHEKLNTMFYNWSYKKLKRKASNHELRTLQIISMDQRYKSFYNDRSYRKNIKLRT